MSKQRLFCLDFENTLVPEFWPIAAERLGVPGLSITSRDYPNQRDLMQKRIELLQEHKITMSQLKEIVIEEEPLKGARRFIEKLRHHSPRIIIVSDFEERLAAHLVDQFENITFFGHKFVTNPDDTISHYDFRQDDSKKRVVEAMHLLNFEVYAVGDSYNDIVMMQTADKGFFINAPDKIRKEHPEFTCAQNYSELYELLTAE